MSTKTIYIELLNEGTVVYRPVQASPVGKDLFRIESINEDPEDEEWCFPTGTIVRCGIRKLSGAEEALVAIDEISS